MAKIEGKNEWSDVVLRENGDVLSGGIDGKVNEQPIALVNRTNWIKENMKKFITKINGKESIENEINLTTTDIGAAALGHTHDNEYMKLLKVTANDAGKVVRTKMDGSGFELSVVSELPIGSIIAFAGKTVPFGFLECDGRVLSRGAYIQLYEAIGTLWGSTSESDFKLPNLTEAERFLRSRSESLSVGTLQGDAIRNITGAVGTGVIYNHATYTSGAIWAGGKVNGGGGGNVPEGNYGYIFDASRVVPTADENRPKSAVVMYCIKVLDSVRDPEQVLAQAAIADMAHRNEVKELAGTQLWVSGEHIPVFTKPTIVIHGLNLDPFKCRYDVLLKCVVAEHGYQIGETAISPVVRSHQYVPSPLVPMLTTTTIQINTGMYATGINAMQKLSGSEALLTLANWRYIFRIWH